MYDLVVIGGGSGGLAVAKAAAKFGAKVALIEKDRLGGEAVLGACLPSKGLAQAANLVHELRGASRFGVTTAPVQVDFPRVIAHVREVVGDLAARDSADTLREQGIAIYQGSASFAAYDTVQLSDGTAMPGQRFVIATGSRPAIPDIPGLKESGYLDNLSFWSLSTLPESIIILGKDPTGVEFAQALARLGTIVTVLTDAPRILPDEDPDASALIARLLTADGVTIGTGVEVTKVEVRGNRTICHFQDPASGGGGEAAAQVVLVAAGRMANVEGLDLEAVGIHGDAEHGIAVDDYLQTHAPRVYAIGDVLLKHADAHVAEREAEVAVKNALLRMKKKVDYSIMPRGTFTDPEVASAGISELEARTQELPHRVHVVFYSEITRARIDGRTEGFAKVVTTPAGKILGATVVGKDASLIIHELSLALARNLNLGDLAAPVAIYPTYAEILSLLGHQQRVTRLEAGYIQAALRLFYGFVPRTAAGNGTAPPDRLAKEADPAEHHGHGH
jgi:pyruvate/2-oxoglutarate dehydrogenase complex dihydrolipoamide dehydrogenase (E3) component